MEFCLCHSCCCETSRGSRRSVVLLYWFLCSFLLSEKEDLGKLLCVESTMLKQRDSGICDFGNMGALFVTLFVRCPVLLALYSDGLLGMEAVVVGPSL